MSREFELPFAPTVLGMLVAGMLVIGMITLATKSFEPSGCACGWWQSEGFGCSHVECPTGLAAR